VNTAIRFEFPKSRGESWLSILKDYPATWTCVVCVFISKFISVEK
jgi:hypothetical protein